MIDDPVPVGDWPPGIQRPLCCCGAISCGLPSLQPAVALADEPSRKSRATH